MMELIDELGERFSELKRLRAGEFLFCAYDIEQNKAFGKTAKEALENLRDGSD